jgi:hypothetical protein
MINSAVEREKLPTAHNAQTVSDILPILQDLRKLQRLHEDRSLPTMALVIKTIVKFSSIVRNFKTANENDTALCAS